MSRRTELENRLRDYGISLNTAEVAEILACNRKTVSKIQKSGKLKSFIIDSDSQRVCRKTMKEDLINYLLEQERGGSNDS